MKARFLLDAYGDNVLGRGAWIRGESVGASSSSIYAGLKVGDDLYLGGPFNAMVDGSNVALGYDAFHIARWDGETYHAVGTGVDEGRINVIHAVDDVLYLGGRFRRAYNGSATYETPLVIGYDVVAKEFVTLGDGISRAGVNSPEVLAIEHDPVTGDLYIGGNFIYGSHPDHDDVSSRGLIRWSGGEWHHVVDLYGGGSDFPSQVNTLKIIGNQLYIGGFFTSIPDRSDYQRNLAQLDLGTGSFHPIDFPEELSLSGRIVVALGTDGEHLYFLVNIYDHVDVRTVSLFRKHLESGNVESLNGILRGNSSSTTNYGLAVDGEFVYVHGNYFNLRQRNHDGEIMETPMPVNAVSFFALNMDVHEDEHIAARTAIVRAILVDNGPDRRRVNAVTNRGAISTDGGSLLRWMHILAAHHTARFDRR